MTSIQQHQPNHYPAEPSSNDIMTGSGYCIRPGFLAPGLPAKTEEQEQEIGAPVLLGKLGSNQDGPDLTRPMRDIPKTFRTISRVQDIEKDNAQWIRPPRRLVPRQEPVANTTPRYWSEGSSSSFTKVRNSELAHDLWMNPHNLQIPEWNPPLIPRPSGVDDDKSVPEPDVDGLPNMWSMADFLTRNLKDHLTSLTVQYTKTTPTMHGTRASLLEHLAMRFEADKRAIERLRPVMCRHRSIESLQVFPGYREAICTLRIRLNAWLEAWETHGEDLQDHDSDDSITDSPLLSAIAHDNGHDNNHQPADQNSAKDKCVDIAHDEHPTIDIVKQHLRDWLNAIDRLPEYPKLETYIEKDRPQHWTWAITEQKDNEKKQAPGMQEKQQAKVDTSTLQPDQFLKKALQQSNRHNGQGVASRTMEKVMQGPAKSAGKEHKRDTSTSLFDHFRTSARKSFDERARQGGAPKTPKF